jgi:GxxExxY protein
MLIYEEESYAIKGACMQVYRAMGNGFLESVYQECVEIEFSGRGIPFEAQRLMVLNYNGMQLRQKFRADFLCYGKIIVEIKAVSSLAPEHYSQLMNYLKATGTRLGFLFNFGNSHLLQQKRIVC